MSKNSTNISLQINSGQENFHNFIPIKISQLNQYGFFFVSI